MCDRLYIRHFLQDILIDFIWRVKTTIENSYALTILAKEGLHLCELSEDPRLDLMFLLRKNASCAHIETTEVLEN